jgi:hypothetical protein
MQFSVEEICRIFNVPPHMIQKLDRATFNNIEHLSRQFYTGTLVPWINRLEATLDRALLTRSERLAGYRIRHNAEGLLRGDLASRSDWTGQTITRLRIDPAALDRLHAHAVEGFLASCLGEVGELECGTEREAGTSLCLLVDRDLALGQKRFHDRTVMTFSGSCPKN